MSAGPVLVTGTTVAPELLWTATRVAEYLGVDRRRVYELDIPQVRIGERTIRYDPEDVQTWVLARKQRRAR